jgi:hypothetical protein
MQRSVAFLSRAKAPAVELATSFCEEKLALNGTADLMIYLKSTSDKYQRIWTSDVLRDQVPDKRYSVFLGLSFGLADQTGKVVEAQCRQIVFCDLNSDDVGAEQTCMCPVDAIRRDI